MLTRAFVLGALTCKTAYFIAPALWKYELRFSWPHSVVFNFTTTTHRSLHRKYSLNLAR